VLLVDLKIPIKVAGVGEGGDLEGWPGAAVDRGGVWGIRGMAGGSGGPRRSLGH
jgi:hypothetical protein